MNFKLIAIYSCFHIFDCSNYYDSTIFLIGSFFKENVEMMKAWMKKYMIKHNYDQNFRFFHISENQIVRNPKPSIPSLSGKNYLSQIKIGPIGVKKELIHKCS